MRSINILAALAMVFAPVYAFGQIVPPAPGVEMPQAYYDMIAQDPMAFQFQKAWLGKYKRVQDAQREVRRLQNDGVSLAAVPADLRSESVMAGTVTVPVILIKYADTGANPFTTTQVRDRLFTGAGLTITKMYNEMSYGNVTLTGDVVGWAQANNNGTYYEGGNNGLPPSPPAQTGELLLEAFQWADPTMDFGLYDNDGPDGLPNSGDDDGFVDFVAIVHPETGGECGGPNMWSHRWVVGGWPEFVIGSVPSPWTTNDPKTGGGFIQIWDYTIQPVKGSSNGCGAGLIEIGVFCHEFGHAFGLPDLYDTNKGGQGIGRHGLMGSGNWQTPINPTHMCAWSKMQLGWLTPVVVGPSMQQYSLANVEMNAQAYQLNIMEEKFSRQGFDPIAGAFSLRCGLRNLAASNRNWVGGKGYGNNWDEAVRRDFTYDGSGTVTLEYDVSWDTEATYDYGRIKIKVGATETTLREYDGIGALTNVAVNLTPYLSGPTDYQIIAEFTSDFAKSDEDGIENFDSGFNGPFKLDNISVTGGGENYFNDFEQNEGGWYYDFSENPNREYFLVENHHPAGALFGQNAIGTGLHIWHIEDNLGGDNTSGSTSNGNLRPANVELETADGLNQLLLGSNVGDTGDVYPGSSNNRTFNDTSNPSSKSHNNTTTHVIVQNISAAGATMTADMQAGYFPPTVTSVEPDSGETGNAVQISDIQGTGIIHGATFMIRDAGGASSAPRVNTMLAVPAMNVEWFGKSKLAGEFDLAGVAPGVYDLVVQNPDGQEATLVGGFTVVDPVPVLIQLFTATATDAGVELVWELYADEAISGFKVLRRVPGSSEDWVKPGTLIPSHSRSFLDDTVDPAKRYEYVLVVVLPDGTELRSTRASAQTQSLVLHLFQNHPNPFNPSTRIQFSLPERQFVTLSVYDALGRQVRRLVNGVRSAGVSEAVWDGRNDAGDSVSSGVYFYQLRAEKSVLTKKLLLLK